MAIARPHKLVLGFAHWGVEVVPIEEMANTLKLAVDSGIDEVDCAPHYGDGIQENILGVALKLLPQDKLGTIKVTTKAGRIITPNKQADNSNGFTSSTGFAQRFDYSGKGIKKSARHSQLRLMLSSFHGLYLHDMDPQTHGEAKFAGHSQVFFDQKDGGYQAFQSLKEQGRAQVIGIGSNDAATTIQMIKDGKFKIDRVMIAGCYNLLDHSALAELFPLCKQRGIQLYIAAPYAGGILSDPQNLLYKYQPASAEIRAKKEKMIAICSKYHIPLAHAAMQFAHMHPQVARVVVGARTRKELTDSLNFAKTPLALQFWLELRDSGLIAAESIAHLTAAAKLDMKAMSVAPNADVKLEKQSTFTNQAIDIVDAHQHFWKFKLHSHPTRPFYKWMKNAPTPLKQDFLPQDLSAIRQKHGIKKTILVQASANQLETVMLLEFAKKHEFIAGVVGWVNMEMPTALKILNDFMQNPKFVGIRPMLQDIEDPQWMLNPKFKPIYELLIKNNLVFEALVKPYHLEHLIKLLTAFPALKVVIDHAAKPRIADHKFDASQWTQQMFILAKNPNVSCKLSGLLSEAPANCTYKDIQPYLDVLYQTFGPKRLIWGSDWPVVNTAGGYDKWVDMTQRFILEKNITLEDQRAMLGGNAMKLYAPRTSQALDAKVTLHNAF